MLGFQEYFNSRSSAMNILIIDDHQLFADGLKLVLDRIWGAAEYRVDQAQSAQRALDYIDAGNSYQLILTDLGMPGIDGHELVQSLISRKVSGCIAVISGSNSLSDISRAYKLGARGYIYKSESAHEMQSKLRELISGKVSFPDRLWDSIDNQTADTEANLQKCDDPAYDGIVGKRPMDVLELLAQGKSNKQIASILNISETTVKFHVRTLFLTLEVNNRTWCVREAVRRGLIEDPS